MFETNTTVTEANQNVQIVDDRGIVHFLRQGQPLIDLIREIRNN